MDIINRQNLRLYSMYKGKQFGHRCLSVKGIKKKKKKKNVAKKQNVHGTSWALDIKFLHEIR